MLVILRAARAADTGNTRGDAFPAPPVGLTLIVRVVRGGSGPLTFGLVRFLRLLVRGLLGSGRWGSTRGRKGTEPFEVVPHTNTGRKSGVAEHTGVQHVLQGTGALGTRSLVG